MESDSLESTAHPPYDSTRSLLRHLRVDGFPAVYAVDVIPFANYHEVALYVYIPTVHILCCLTEQTFDEDLEQANREMQAIISSFHIEKVVPPGNAVKEQGKIRP